MKKVFIAYGTDYDEIGGGYGCEAHLIYADNIADAAKLVPESLKVEEIIEATKNITENKVRCLCRKYE